MKDTCCLHKPDVAIRLVSQEVSFFRDIQGGHASILEVLSSQSFDDVSDMLKCRV